MHVGEPRTACVKLCGAWSVLAWGFIPNLQPPLAYRPVMLFVLPRFFKSLWRSVLTSLIVRAASVTTTHCVAGVLWSTSVLEDPSAGMERNQWDGCRIPVSASQPQSPPTGLSWMTLRLWVLFIVLVHAPCFTLSSLWVFRICMSLLSSWVCLAIL